MYVEKEDEFESEISSEDETEEEKLGDGAFGKSLIKGLTKKQKKLARVDVDIDWIDPEFGTTPE